MSKYFLVLLNVYYNLFNIYTYLHLSCASYLCMYIKVQLNSYPLLWYAPNLSFLIFIWYYCGLIPFACISSTPCECYVFTWQTLGMNRQPMSQVPQWWLGIPPNKLHNAFYLTILHHIGDFNSLKWYDFIWYSSISSRSSVYLMFPLSKFFISLMGLWPLYRILHQACIHHSCKYFVLNTCHINNSF